MDNKIKEVLKRAVEVAHYRGGDMNIENESDVATTSTDSMIYLEGAITEAFGLESNEYREIFNQIDRL